MKRIIAMDYIATLGYLAGALTTLAFLPQLIKVIKTRSTRDISLVMFVVICTGIFLWLIYGILINSLPIILANIVTLIIAGAILILKIKYR
jgi:MtN3 and saliva related transmembrane protein